MNKTKRNIVMTTLLIAGGVVTANPPPTAAQSLPVQVATASQPDSPQDTATTQVATTVQDPNATAQQNLLDPQAEAVTSYAQLSQALASASDPTDYNTWAEVNPFGNGQNTFSFRSPERSRAALVVRSSQTESADLAAMQEDLNIMGHILEKAVHHTDQDESHQAMGIQVFSAGSSGSPKFLQIEGYGALFMLNVNFPLLGPPAKPAPEKAKAPTNSSWDEAKRELYGHTDGEGDQPPAHEEFDYKRVEKLESSVLEALKNAANMRHLPDGEGVTVVVTSDNSTVMRHGGMMGGVGSIGGGGAGGQPNVSVNTTSSASGGAGGTTTGTTTVATGTAPAGGTAPTAAWNKTNSGGSGGHARFSNRLNRIVTHASRSGPESVLTLSVKKSDIEAFAKGSIDLNEFRAKAKIHIN